MSEARRGLVRISSNFVRLGLILVFGMLRIPLLILAVGNDGMGLVYLLGPTMGFTAVLEEIVRGSIVRELGAALHSGDDRRFRLVYNTLLALCGGMSVLHLVLFSALILLLPVIPFIDVPAELMGAAQIFIVTQLLRVMVSILVAAPFQMYQVTERMVLFNMMALFNHGGAIVAAGIVLLVDPADAAQALILYGILSSAIFIVAQLVFALLMMFRYDRRTMPRLSEARRSAVRSILKVGGWNFAQNSSQQFAFMADTLLMNMWFGVGHGNLVFGLASQPTRYLRNLALGVSRGSAAVSARLDAQSGAEGVQKLTYHTIRLVGVAIFPAAALMIALDRPLMTLWVGHRVGGPDSALMLETILLVPVLAIAFSARAVSESWHQILYGAGHVHRYAPYILVGNLFNPLIALGLLVLLPDPSRFLGPALAFLVVNLLVNLGAVPILCARLIEIPVSAVYAPLTRPFLVTLLCTPLLVAAALVVDTWTWPLFLSVVAAFGVVYLLSSLFLTFTRDERHRALTALRSRASRRS